MTLVYAITQANQYGWGSAETVGFFAAAPALLVGFVAWEARTSDPIMPLSIFRLRTLVGANIAGLILGTVLFSMFLMLTLYMQQVLGYSPLKTGFAYLAVAGTAIVWSARGGATRHARRRQAGPRGRDGVPHRRRGVLHAGLAGGSYVTDLLPGFLVIAVGMGFSFVPISIAALAASSRRRRGSPRA